MDTEEARIIVTARARLDWIETLPEPDRTWASYGVPQDQWRRLTAIVEDTLSVIRNETHRVWHPNPHYMKPNEPVGHWTTERK